jgi:hypothetical protein
MDTTSEASTSAQPPATRISGQIASHSIRPRQERSASDNTISPTASIEKSDTNSSDDGPRRRPLHERRPYSDYGQMHRKIRVQTIAEDTSHYSVPLDETAQLRGQFTRSTTSPLSHRASASASSKSSETGPLYTHIHEPSSGSDTPAGGARPSTRPNLGGRWSRTKFGSVWYERLRNSPGKSRDSLPVTVGEVSPQSLMPLTPPKPLPDQAGTADQHLVRVEKSFTRLKGAEVPAAKPADTSSPASRKSSINPRKIFSAPLQLVRRISFTRRKSKVISLHSFSPSSMQRSQRLADHKSLIKRNRTWEALRRVDSILGDHNDLNKAASPVSVINRLHARSMSQKSTSSKGSTVPKSKTKPRGRSEWKVEGGHRYDEVSLETLETASYTSSQLALRLGAQPNNTPDERATYKVKRSPSAETEEFLKVDISIRGGTSYLPSEARRIHTPPLPQDGLDGKRRGFFFDYNAPRQSQSKKEETLDPASIPARSASRVSTVGKRAFMSAGRIVTKAKTSDWYDAKLAQLEEPEDDSIHKGMTVLHPIYQEPTKEKSAYQGSLSEVRKLKEKETFDMNIPEHLPSSPLCPRHPKYWRVVKGKGSQFRGCWMHGVGPWDDPVNFK